MYRKTVIISIFTVLAIIALLVFVPAKLADSKEQKAAQLLEKAYGESFAVAKSNALQRLFSDTFTITVQSVESEVVYDFTMHGDTFTGDYYTEQLNVQVAKLLEEQVNGLVLAKTNVAGLTTQTPLQEATITAVKLMVLTEQPLAEQEVRKLAQTLYETIGEVAVQIDLLVIDDEEAFNGVTYEIQHFFQQSTITTESFDGLEFELQQVQF